MRHAIVLFSLLTLATGCATRTAEQKTAERLAGQVSQMQTNLASLAESRVNIAAARALVSQRLLRSALETEVINAENKESLLTAEQRARVQTAIANADTAVQRKAKRTRSSPRRRRSRGRTHRVSTRDPRSSAPPRSCSATSRKNRAGGSRRSSTFTSSVR